MKESLITYEQIKQANDAIRTTPIPRKDKDSGKVVMKEYAEVNERIKAFRMVYPDGFIRTEIISNENGTIIMRAYAGYYDESGLEVTLGTGTAREKEGSSYINKTSFIENCETSCVGRCLGMLGFGIDTSIASAEEVQNAIAQQETKSEPVHNDVLPEKPRATISKSEWENLNLMYTKEQIKAMCSELGIIKGTNIPVDYYKQKEKEYLAKIGGEMPEKPFYE